MDDAELLSDYVRNRSERAFRELVGRHLALVYSSALRQVRDPGLAEDVSQGVFLVLAQRADTIRAGCALSGWLLTTTRYVAASALRARFRRSNHEFKAAAMRPEVQESEPADAWALMQADIDQALAKLTEPERDVVALRFFEGKSLADVARSIGVTEEAARKRVGRAVEKLRKHLAGKGIRVIAARRGQHD
jgi:RNA polymerase sigma factor (sigma-70 family)